MFPSTTSLSARIVTISWTENNIPFEQKLIVVVDEMADDADRIVQQKIDTYTERLRAKGIQPDIKEDKPRKLRGGQIVYNTNPVRKSVYQTEASTPIDDAVVRFAYLWGVETGWRGVDENPDDKEAYVSEKLRGEPNLRQRMTAWAMDWQNINMPDQDQFFRRHLAEYLNISPSSLSSLGEIPESEYTQLLDRARAVTDQTLREAKSEADSIIRSAEAQSKRILKDAEAKSAKILKEAEQQTAQIRKDAFRMMNDASEMLNSAMSQRVSANQEIATQWNDLRVFTEKAAMQDISRIQTMQDPIMSGTAQPAKPISMNLDLSQPITQPIAPARQEPPAPPEETAAPAPKHLLDGALDQQAVPGGTIPADENRQPARELDGKNETPPVRTGPNENDDPEPTPEPGAQAGSDAGSNSNEDNGPESTPEPGAQAGSDTGSNSNEDNGPEHTPDPREQTSSDADSNSGENNGPEHTPDPREQTSSDTDSNSGENNGPEHTPDPREQTSSDTDSNSGENNDPEPTPEPNVQADSDTGGNSNEDNSPKPTPDPGAQACSDAGSNSGEDNGPEPTPSTDAQAGSDTGNDSSKNTSPEPTPSPDAQAGPDKTADPDANQDSQDTIDDGNSIPELPAAPFPQEPAEQTDDQEETGLTDNEGIEGTTIDVDGDHHEDDKLFADTSEFENQTGQQAAPPEDQQENTGPLDDDDEDYGVPMEERSDIQQFGPETLQKIEDHVPKGWQKAKTQTLIKYLRRVQPSHLLTVMARPEMTASLLWAPYRGAKTVQKTWNLYNLYEIICGGWEANNKEETRTELIIAFLQRYGSDIVVDRHGVQEKFDIFQYITMILTQGETL